jgi:hypothetical protein
MCFDFDEVDEDGDEDVIKASFVPFDFISSAASALEMFSCFFHFVRRF